MDEKVALSLQTLGAKLQKQIDKRVDAPIPSDAALTNHLAVVTAPVTVPTVATPAQAGDDFFTLWDQYYPRIVSLLGWASWVLPGPALAVIKSLLAVINNDVMPILKQLMKK